MTKYQFGYFKNGILEKTQIIFSNSMQTAIDLARSNFEDGSTVEHRNNCEAVVYGDREIRVRELTGLTRVGRKRDPLTPRKRERNRRIREEYARGEKTQDQLAREFKVAPSTICRILKARV